MDISLLPPTGRHWDRTYKRSRRAPARLSLPVLGAGLLTLGLLLLMFMSVPYPQSWKMIRARNFYPIPDSFSQHGTLFLHPTDPSQTNWMPIDPNFPPAPNYVATINQFLHDMSTNASLRTALSTQSSSPISLEFLRNKTVLLLGDSVDRNSIIHFCQLISRPIKITSWKNSTRLAPPIANQSFVQAADAAVPFYGPDFEGFDQRGLPHLCEIPELDFLILNGFHFGMDDKDLFNSSRHPDWRPPGKFEDRIDILIKPYMAKSLTRSRTPDLVVWSSGLWDVALFGTEDELQGTNFTTALEKSQIDWWIRRARETISQVQSSFPDALLVMRKMHRVNANKKEVRWMQDLRIHQIQNAQESVSREFDFYKIFDFGKIFEGHQALQENVHPLTNPSLIIVQAYLHYLKQAFDLKLI